MTSEPEDVYDWFCEPCGRGLDSLDIHSSDPKDSHPLCPECHQRVRDHFQYLTDQREKNGDNETRDQELQEHRQGRPSPR